MVKSDTGKALVKTNRLESLNRIPGVISRHWLLMLNVFMGIFVTLPFSAPVLMRLGVPGAANAVYTIYSTQCHQLPQRSYFLFGERLTYSLDEINLARGSEDVWTLREFIGNERMGYKVAWSDRMISIYTSVFLGGLVYALLRRRVGALPIALAVLLVLPMVLDGASHFVSDLAGIGRGFRDMNEWLRALTGNALPSTFYKEDGWGSFNSLMRLVTGALSGLAIAWAVFPRVDKWLNNG